MVNKALEWKELFAGGFTFGTSTASSIYYVLTGVHGAHVVAGLVALIYLMVKAIKAVGNYGEMFERNVGPKSVLKLPRGSNNLWNKGGLMYGLPVR